MSIRKLSLRAERTTDVTPPAPNLEPVAHYNISGSIRGLTERQVVELEAEHVVELHFEDEARQATTWLCNRDTLEDVFPQAAATKVGRGDAEEAAFELPMTLSNADTERGVVGSLLLKGFGVFAKKEIGRKVKDIASDLEKVQLEHYSGLYRLGDAFQFQPYTPVVDDKPYLIFLHGTGSSTKGSFGELVGSPLWSYIRQTYGANVLAFQHESLTKSPLQNARELAAALPARATIDIISHSRGGLVGDVLCRFAGSGTVAGFSEEELGYLRKDGDRAYDLQEIESLRGEMATRRITVRRFVRVACPAAGTVLASKRLDNFLNVLLNLVGYGTGVAASPVYSLFKELIGEVVGCKNDSDSLPGLEAMNPESPFIKVLNSPASPVAVDSPLAVVSGNCKASVNLKGLLIIASKIFYLQDNDLVVNTASMYLGARRHAPAQYFFDETGETDHFHYFKNKRTTEAIRQALSTADGQPIPGFSAVRSGTGTRAERNAVLKLEGGQYSRDTVSGTRPIVVMLPGIMGSNLTRDNDLVWINYWQFIKGGLTKLDMGARGIKAPSLIKSSYQSLGEALQADYDVVTFSFDWRKQLTTQAALFETRIKELMAFGQPIKIVAHSMGGVLVRDFIINHDDTWQALNRSSGFRLLFLGAPLGGSFRIPAVLFGQDAIINKLAKIDLAHTKKELLDMFCDMPGLLSLLPVTTDEPNDFTKLATWKAMSVVDSSWPLPSASELDVFKTYRDKIIAAMPGIDFSNAAYIAGRDKATPCAYRIDETAAGKDLTFLSTAEGDQSVTWASGIPQQMLQAGSVYYVNVTHGALAADPSIFRGIADLLRNKTTHLLSRTRPVVRGEDALFKAPVQQDFDLSPEGVERSLLGLDDTTTTMQVAGTPPLRVSVSQGDLRYAGYPVLAGHFKGDGVLYAEKSIDYNLGGALTARHRLGLYPGEVGTSEVVIVRGALIKGALIAGLGLPGSLTAFQLTSSIEQAVCNYLLRYNSPGMDSEETGGGAQGIGISSLIVGCAYGGLSVYNAVRAIAEGVQSANNKMRAIHGDGAATVQYLEFVEQYEDRALSCFQALSRIEAEESRAVNIQAERRKIKKLPGARKRLPTEAMEEWWNRITVQQDLRDGLHPTESLFFSASTGGAREEKRELFTSTPLIEGLLDELSVKNHWTPELAKTIFELLIPNDFKEQLKKQCNINWILDEYTAAYPWELLQDTATNARPLCINAGMIRQLATDDYRTRINPVTARTALVIAEPALDGFLPALGGARQEGVSVSEALAANGYETTECIGKRTGDILQDLMSRDYKIMHLAGHGVFNPASPAESGMVIGKDRYLSSRQIGQISNVPELVFVNCCYLGGMKGEAEVLSQQRYRLAANIGTQLINNGVKAVVAAGWAVDDAAALDFAEAFYKYMFEGHTFGNAVQKARKKVYQRHGSSTNTWGAYQCYGDPFYRLAPTTTVAQPKKEAPRYEFVIPEEAEIELDNLGNALDMGDYGHDDFLTRVAAISEAVDRAGIRNAVITEQEANIYADLYEYDLAVARFESLLSMEEASFAFSALERYCNIRSKKYALDYIESGGKDKTLAPLMKEVIDDMVGLIRISGPTSERLSILGSVWKRAALVQTSAVERAASYAQAATFYQKAAQLSSNAYTITNWYGLESILVLTGKRSWQSIIGRGADKYTLPAAADAAAILTKLKKSSDNSPDDLDYWDLLADANIDLCLLLVNNTNTSASWEGLLNSYRSVWQRAGSKGKKRAEAEYLELLINGLSLTKSTTAKSLMARIAVLKKELEKLI